MTDSNGGVNGTGGREATALAVIGALDDLCGRVAGGASLSDVAAAWGIRAVALAAWLQGDRGRVADYDLALRVLADRLANETISIADDSVDAGSTKGVSAARLRVESRFRLASKLDRARFGDVHDAVNVNVDNSIRLTDARAYIASRIEGIAARLGPPAVGSADGK